MRGKDAALLGEAAIALRFENAFERLGFERARASSKRPRRATARPGL